MVGPDAARRNEHLRGCARRNVDLILLDINMRRMDDFESERMRAEQMRSRGREVRHLDM
jgi:CheY-like chemotaxis protein